MRATFLLAASLLALSACDSMVDGSNARASITSRAFSDMRDAWTDAFTYHPKEPPNAPQTRYCYQMMTDIVCYDSVQPGLTAKLAGYQDGNHMSWIQPGGGSLGASGGNPVALKNLEKVNHADAVKVKRPLEYTPVTQEVPSARPGEIQSMNLPSK